MKKLLLTISFLTLLSSALMAKTETITEEVCNAPNGCRIEMTTGKCIGCVIITRTIVTKDPISLVEEVEENSKLKPRTITSTDTKKSYKIDPVTGLAFARCIGGCPSSRAANMRYMHEGMYWRNNGSPGYLGDVPTLTEEMKEWVKSHKL